MSKSITCGCGFVVEAATDEGLLELAERHVRAAHADALSLLASTALGRLRNELTELDRRVRRLELTPRQHETQGGMR